MSHGISFVDKKIMAELTAKMLIEVDAVKFMEDKLEWHYLPMKEEQYRQALADLVKIESSPE